MTKVEEGLSWLIIQSPEGGTIPREKLRDIYADLQEMGLSDDEIQETLKRYYKDKMTAFLVTKLILGGAI